MYDLNQNPSPCTFKVIIFYKFTNHLLPVFSYFSFMLAALFFYIALYYFYEKGVYKQKRKISAACPINTKSLDCFDICLDGYKIEQQGYKACMGLLKLADKYTPDRLENACKRALSFTPRPSYKNIQVISLYHYLILRISVNTRPEAMHLDCANYIY